MQTSSLRRGRFELQPNFVRNQWLRALAVALLTLALGVGMSAYAYVLAVDLARVADVWKRGVDSQNEVAYEGTVQTQRLVFKRYELKVRYLPNGADAPVQFETDFMRFVSGPDEGDALGVRYLADDPSQAVTSWQHDGVLHDWAWFALVFAMGLGMTIFTVFLVRRTARIVETVELLANEGQLLYARVESLKREEHSGQQTVQLTYRTLHGEVTHQTFTFGQEPYLDPSGEQVLVLASLDERRSHALASDGSPLSQRPPPPDSGASVPTFSGHG